MNPATKLAIRRGKAAGYTNKGLATQYGVTLAEVREATGETEQRRRQKRARVVADKEVAKMRADARELLKRCPVGFTAKQWRRIVWANYGDVLEG